MGSLERKTSECKICGKIRLTMLASNTCGIVITSDFFEIDLVA